MNDDSRDVMDVIVERDKALAEVERLRELLRIEVGRAQDDDSYRSLWATAEYELAEAKHKARAYRLRLEQAVGACQAMDVAICANEPETPESVKAAFFRFRDQIAPRLDAVDSRARATRGRR